MPQITTCDKRNFLGLCKDQGQQLRAVIELERNQPCWLPAFRPAVWYVLKLQKPVGSVCSEYIWKGREFGKDMYSLNFGCGTLVSLFRLESKPGRESRVATIYEDGTYHCGNMNTATSSDGVLEGEDWGISLQFPGLLDVLQYPIDIDSPHESKRSHK